MEERQDTQTDTKMSYEEQGRVIAELKRQLNMLIQKYREKDIESFYKRLEFDFEVLKMGEAFKENGFGDFVIERMAEIVTMMTPQEQPQAKPMPDPKEPSKPREENEP